MLLLAGALRFGSDIEIASRVLGGLFAVVALFATIRLSPKDPRRPGWSFLIAPTLLTANIALAMWAVHGLETAMFTAFLTLAVRAELHGLSQSRPRRDSAVWFGLATLTRPEGLLLFLVSWFASLGLSWNARHIARRLEQVGVYLAIILPYEVWRLYYYGYPLPNTYYAKMGLSVGLVMHGVGYLSEFLLGPGAFLFLLLAVTLIAAAEDRRIVHGLVTVAAFLGFVILEGGDAFGGFRFIVPICPLLYWLVQEGFWYAWRVAAGRSYRAVGAALFLVAAALHLWQVGTPVVDEARAATGFTRKMRLVGECLRDHLPPDARAVFIRS